VNIKRPIKSHSKHQKLVQLVLRSLEYYVNKNSRFLKKNNVLQEGIVVIYIVEFSDKSNLIHDSFPYKASKNSFQSSLTKLLIKKFLLILKYLTIYEFHTIPSNRSNSIIQDLDERSKQQLYRIFLGPFHRKWVVSGVTSKN
jgi:hypothetical protein